MATSNDPSVLIGTVTNSALNRRDPRREDAEYPREVCAYDATPYHTALAQSKALRALERRDIGVLNVADKASGDPFTSDEAHRT